MNGNSFKNVTMTALCFTLILVPVLGQAQNATPDQTFKVALKEMQLQPGLVDDLGAAPGCAKLLNLYSAVANASFGATASNCDTSKVGADYLIVHLVDWTPSSTNKPTVTWYLLSPSKPRSYQPQTFAASAQTTQTSGATKSGDRIFGSRKVALLIIHRHLSHPAIADIQYSVAVTHKQSVQAADFSSLLSIVGIKAAARVIADEETVYAATAMVNIVSKLPDDIAVSGTAYLDKSVETATSTPDATFNQTYDNEGYSYWDISAAIPVTGIKDVQFTQTGSTITPKTVTRANAYALAHFYPSKVDLKGDYPWQPSIVGGLALSGAPLDKPFAGVAMGTKKPFPFQVNVFAGAVVNKVFTPASTTNATLLQSHRVTKLLVGIDLPIGQLAKAISGK